MDLFNDKIFEYIEKNSLEDIQKRILEITPSLKLNTGISTAKCAGGHYTSASLGDFLGDFKTNITKYRYAYQKWNDVKSKKTFLALIEYRCTLNEKALRDVAEDPDGLYFEKSLLPNHGSQVYVDCGAKTGGSIRRYRKRYGKDIKVFAYEPLEGNFRELVSSFDAQDNILFSNAAVYSQDGSCRFTTCFSANANKIDTEGGAEVRTISLDTDITDRIDFIKMDIESGEYEALKGAERHIRQDAPQLSICVYHVLEDLWRILELIDGFNSYDFYLRYYGCRVNNQYRPFGFVCYAEPKAKAEASINSKRTLINAVNRKNLNNTGFSVFCNNCIGAMILHDLGERFDSPFVNLWLNTRDYIKFLKSPQFYLSRPLEFTDQENVTYPVGLLDDIKIYFMYYKTSQEAFEKWNTRCKRVDFENLYVLYVDRNDSSYSDLKIINDLPYQNIAILTNKKYPELKNAYYIQGFDGQKAPGHLFHFRNSITAYKYFDDFDYVSWFNKNSLRGAK